MNLRRCLLIIFISCNSLLSFAQSFAESNLEFVICSDDKYSVFVSGFASGFKPEKNYSLYVPDVISHSGITFKVVGIMDNAFEYCLQITKVVLGNHVKVIGSRAFCDCYNLKSIEMGDETNIIYPWAFYRCTNLSRVTKTESLKYIGYSCFNNCYSLQSIILSDDTDIGECAFSDCRDLKCIRFPNRIDCLPGGVIAGCSGLESVIIPYSVKRIDLSALKGCTSLKQIIFEGACPPEAEGKLEDIQIDIVAFQLVVPERAVSAFKASPIWGRFYKIEGDPKLDDYMMKQFDNHLLQLIPKIQHREETCHNSTQDKFDELLNSYRSNSAEPIVIQNSEEANVSDKENIGSKKKVMDAHTKQTLAEIAAKVGGLILRRVVDH